VWQWVERHLGGGGRITAELTHEGVRRLVARERQQKRCKPEGERGEKMNVHGYSKSSMPRSRMSCNV
jgi:molybdenum-dependent DNA-binding transcriptional regulator ModE